VERLSRGTLAYCHQLEYADVVVEKEFVENGGGVLGTVRRQRKRILAQCDVVRIAPMILHLFTVQCPIILRVSPFCRILFEYLGIIV